MNYSNILEIVRNKQEAQYSRGLPEPSSFSQYKQTATPDEMGAALLRLDDQFNADAKRFGRNWK